MAIGVQGYRFLSPLILEHFGYIFLFRKLDSTNWIRAISCGEGWSRPWIIDNFILHSRWYVVVNHAQSRQATMMSEMTIEFA